MRRSVQHVSNLYLSDTEICWLIFLVSKPKVVMKQQLNLHIH